jgi:hypothetical protein
MNQQTIKNITQEEKKKEEVNIIGFKAFGVFRVYLVRVA